VLVCNEGYQSSLAAATLQDLGFARATDLVGGFQAWAAAGLPVVHELARGGRDDVGRAASATG
jgi:rhodanese-related sulfurtransferase